MTAPYVSLIPATCELWVDGARFADGSTIELPDGPDGPQEPKEDDPLAPVALQDLAITWGRASTVDQPEPATCSFMVLDPPGGGASFDRLIRLGSAIRVWSELDGRRVIVFDGRVSDMDAMYRPDGAGAQCQVIAVDLAADLANRYIGDEPWPMETVAARVARITALTGVATRVNLAVRPAQVPVSRMDVDRQGAYGLLADLATSSASVIWTGTDQEGAFLRFEDPADRQAGYVLAQQENDLWALEQSDALTSQISAAQVLQDPVHWFRDSTDLLTRATIRWMDQSPPLPDAVIERSSTTVDLAGEAAFGARGISVGTLLTSGQTALEFGAAVLATHKAADNWRSTGLTWDLAVAETPEDREVRGVVMLLLDGNTRAGLSLVLVDLPEWTPTGAVTSLYVEGGTYAYRGGAWLLSLTTVPAGGLGRSLAYETMDPSVRVQDMDPAMTYVSLIGVGRPIGTGLLTYAQCPNWATYADIDPSISYHEARHLDDLELPI